MKVLLPVLAALGVATLACAGPAGRSAPPAPDLAQPRTAEVLGVLAAVDGLAARCRAEGGLTGDAAARLAAWEQQNRVAELRAALDRAVAANPANAQVVTAARAAFDGSEGMKQLPGCVGLGGMLSQPQAALAQQYADVLSALVEPAAPPPAVPAAASDSNIRYFALRQVTRMGFGGMIVIDFEPVLLFSDGRAALDIESLAFPGGPAAHQRAHPDRWGTWRQLAGSTSVTVGGEAQPLFNDKVYDGRSGQANPSGAFRRMGGGGNLAMGGATAIAAWSTMAFTPTGPGAGRLVEGGGAGASTSSPNGETSVTTGGNQGGRAGTYRIDGFTMTVRYDDGAVETSTIIGLPNDPDIVWIDGASYTRRK